MKSTNRVFCAFAALAFSIGIYAQSGTNSPYSQYGLGVLSDQTSGFNRGMNGVGLGFREHNQVNFINPASYSAVDSLSFIFDVGFSGQITNFNESGKKINAKNADFEYAVAAFRVAKGFGVSFGILPYTNVGYNYTSSTQGSNVLSTTYSNSYYGEGGLHQVYVGLGYQLFKGFSLGANVSYLWGRYDKTVTNSYSDSYAKTIQKVYSASVTNYKLDFGVQYAFAVDKKNEFTLGATYSPGHDIGGNPSCVVTSTNPTTSTPETAPYSLKDGLKIPTTVGAGLAWNNANRIKLGVDYSFQKWSGIGFPVYVVNNQVPAYVMNNDYYSDRHKINVGGDFCGDENNRSFLKRLHFRAGASYATPYYKINGQDGPSEISVSAGLGIPIMNSYNNRSMLNISGQWVRTSAKNFIKENTFRINIGLTFNERWFMKWKVD